MNKEKTKLQVPKGTSQFCSGTDYAQTVDDLIAQGDWSQEEWNEKLSKFSPRYICYEELVKELEQPTVNQDLPTSVSIRSKAPQDSDFESESERNVSVESKEDKR